MKVKIIIILLAVYLFSGCSTPSDQIKLDFWHAMADPKDKVLNVLVSDFEKQNPGIKITTQYVGNYDVLLQKLLASVAAGNPPDIAQVYENWTTRFVEEKAIVRIEDFFSRDYDKEKDLQDIYPVFLKNNSYDKKLWTFPFNKSIYVYYYNEALFKKEGLVPPKTASEFLNICTKLTKRDESGKVVRYGFGFRANIDIFAIFLYMNKGRFFNEEETKSTFNNAVGRETLQFISDLYNKYKVAEYSKDYLDNDFASGRLAAFFATSPHRSYLEPLVAFPLGVAPLPAGKVKAVPIAGTNLAIFEKKKKTAGREEACFRFIKWLSGSENNVKWAIGTSYLPIRKSAAENPAMLAHLKKKPFDAVGIHEIENAVPDPRLKCWQEVRIYIGEALEKVLLQRESPGVALDEAAKKVDALLAR
ncbi:MAG: ABC transporter substrate-binding protein [Candidatus Firestonebacteria bacterium]|nr:ABC transporter substrate-binding protein [Candidatus Firestonebacteria bacterium]